MVWDAFAAPAMFPVECRTAAPRPAVGSEPSVGGADITRSFCAAAACGDACHAMSKGSPRRGDKTSVISESCSAKYIFYCKDGLKTQTGMIFFGKVFARIFVVFRV